MGSTVFFFEIDFLQVNYQHLKLWVSLCSWHMLIKRKILMHCCLSSRKWPPVSDHLSLAFWLVASGAEFRLFANFSSTPSHPALVFFRVVAAAKICEFKIPYLIYDIKERACLMTLVMNIKTQKRKNKEIMFLVCDKSNLRVVVGMK